MDDFGRIKSGNRGEGGSPDEAQRGEKTRRRIKLAARRLFALRGIDGVSIREIVKAAGQKNAGSVHYYFKTKEALIEELILDVASFLDTDQNRRVDRMEADGGPHTIREALAVLFEPPTLEATTAFGDEYAVRFVNMVMINHRDLLFGALRDGADRGIRRCLAHLRRFLPDLPARIAQQRLMLLMLILFAVSSSREAAREQPNVWRALWGTPASSENLVDTLVGLLTAPVSAETEGALQQSDE